MEKEWEEQWKKAEEDIKMGVKEISKALGEIMEAMREWDRTTGQGIMGTGWEGRIRRREKYKRRIAYKLSHKKHRRRRRQ